MTPPPWLSPTQWQTLIAICDTLIPALSPAETKLPALSASDLAVPEFVAAAIATQSAAQQAQFRQLLDLLGSPLAGWPFRAFQARTPAEREALLRDWGQSPIPLKRQGFQVLKRLATFGFYALTDERGRNPNWDAIGYGGPFHAPPAVAPSLAVAALDGATTLHCDVVIVGSGAGGGVTAGVLTAAGANVIVLEKGGYYDRADFDQRELSSMQRMYEAQGLLATTDLGVSILAGACVGGGTTINWAASLRTPRYVLEEWAHDHGLHQVLTPEYEASFLAVERRLHIDTDESWRNPQNEALWRGCTALGYEVRPMPRNVQGCEARECGFCTFGCQRGAKQSMAWTTLADAVAGGARLFPNAEVRQVMVEGGRAVGVRATIGGREVVVRARMVVVAAGAIHTPALLLRSGLRHPHLGRHLHLHPTVAVSGFYPQQMCSWEGVMMAAISDQFARLDGNWGVKLETPPTHTGMMALALPWESPRQHKRMMAEAARLGSFIVLTRDRFGGRVALDRQGAPRIHYRLSRYDRRHLLAGIAAAARVHAAAGAEEILFPHSRLKQLRLEERSLDGFMAGMERWGWEPNQFNLFSAHQMGSCRMGSDPARHVLTPEGESREVSQLFVTDGSVFPSASGANPMLSIQALAHFTATGLARRL